MRTFGHKLLQTGAAGRNGTKKTMKVSLLLTVIDIRVDAVCFNTAANGGAIPFNTQFFHDDYDDGPGFDDVFEGEGDGVGAMPDVDAGEQDLLAATAGQTRRVRPEFVNYAKRAKRVDVRKLKENIWKGLDIRIAEAKEETEDESMVRGFCPFSLPLYGDVHVFYIYIGYG